ncbi:MAG: hypothetical protein K2K91_04330 [Ruminococcus sp.]|nr:hypothetical protein [Ruminococcus sp.]
MKNITERLGNLKSGLLKIAATVGAVFSVAKIKSFADECKSLWNVQLEAETRLGAILKGNLGATNEQIQSLKDYASELQNIGVIGDEVQLSGLQELSTYIENADNLKPMMSVLTDMLAQQYGLNATAESAVTISTMLGKVLGGQTSALSRYGYFFDEAQEQLLKFGTEEQRVATLAEVVSASVGGVNEALAQTNAGKMQQLSNTIGDIKEQFGDAVYQIEAIFLPALNRLAEYLAEIATLAQKAAESLAGVFGVESDKKVYSNGMNSGLEDVIDLQESLTEAVEETEKAQKNSLATFDKINTISSGNDDKKDDISADSPHTPIIRPTVDESNVDDAVDELAEKFRRLLMPIKVAWEDNSPEFIENAKHTVNSVKSLFSSIGNSIEEVWTNGSGEEYVGNIIRLFGDITGIIGDISTALKNAWEDDGRGEKLVQSYFNRWNALFELIHVVSEDFREVWNNGTGEEILGNILEIQTNINNTVTNLRENFKKAWSENEVGQRIIKGVLDIFKVISETVNDITFSTSEWTKNVDFSSFLESVDSLLESLEPLTENIGEGLENFYNDVLLPLASWTIEDLIPTFLESLSDAIDGVNSAWETAYPVVKEKLWDKFLQPIAKFTANAATKAIKLLGSAIKKIGESITENQVATLIDFAKGIGALILVSKGYVFLTNLSSTIGKIPTILAGLAPKISGVITALGSTATLSLSTVFAGISAFIAGYSITTAILDWTGWDKDLEKFGEDLYDFFNEDVSQFISNWSEFWSGYGEYLYNFFSGIKEDIQQTFSDIGDWFKEKFQTAKDNITTIFEDVGTWFSDRWNDVKSVLSDVGDWFKKQFETALNNVTETFKNIGIWFKNRWNDVKSKLSEVGEWFKNKFQTAWDNVTSIFKGIGTWFGNRWNGVKSALSEVADWFKNKFQTAWDNVTSIFSNFSGWFGEKWDKIKSVYSETGDFFKEKFQSAWNNITEIFSNPAGFFNGVWDGIKGCFSHVSDWFRDTFSEAWEKVKNVFSSGGEIFNGITNGIFETFKSVVNNLIDGINAVIAEPFHAINSALDSIRGAEIMNWYPFEWLPSISIPEIPKLAQGTVVPANYGEFMAILGDNKRETEIVSPLSTIEKAVQNAMQKSGGNFPKEIVLNVYLSKNSSAFSREIIKIVDDDRRRRGG